ncbi:MAG: hypothetical protein O7F17_04545, partial [Planctomycetota bacterium]|nr:hypothetical protein [Planctomycetota bacterium]
SAMALKLTADDQRRFVPESTDNLPMIYNTQDRLAPIYSPKLVNLSNRQEVVIANFVDSLIHHGLIFLGWVLMITPLALWVAWTGAIFLGVLATGATALVLYGLLEQIERPADPAQSKASDYVRARILPDTSIEELQNLHPYIHHHRPTGGSKFHTAMNRLKKHLY